MTTIAGISSRKLKSRQIVKKIALYAMVFGVSVLTIFPIYWMIVGTLQPNKYTMSFPPPLFPREISFTAAVQLFTDAEVELPPTIGRLPPHFALQVGGPVHAAGPQAPHRQGPRPGGDGRGRRAGASTRWLSAGRSFGLDRGRRPGSRPRGDRDRTARLPSDHPCHALRVSEELMATRKQQPGYVLAPGPDVDLAREDIRDSAGRRITEEYVEQAVADVHAPDRTRPPSPGGSRDALAAGHLPAPRPVARPGPGTGPTGGHPDLCGRPQGTGGVPRPQQPRVIDTRQLTGRPSAAMT